MFSQQVLPFKIKISTIQSNKQLNLPYKSSTLSTKTIIFKIDQMFIYPENSNSQMSPDIFREDEPLYHFFQQNNPYFFTPVPTIEIEISHQPPSPEPIFVELHSMHPEAARIAFGTGFKRHKLENKVKHLKPSTPCAVCLENFERRTKVVKLECKHVYHFKCLKKWYAKRTICPLCRSKIEL